MRILLLSSGSGSRGGGEIFLHYLSRGLVDAGHEVVVWLPAHARMNELAEKCAASARVIRRDYRNTYDYGGRSLATWFNWGLSAQLANEWTELRPDVIHLNKQNLEDGLDLLRAVRLSGLPSVCTIHLTQTARYLGAQAPWLRDRIARDALSKYRGILIAVQEARRLELDSFLGGDVRTATIWNGVPLRDRGSLGALRASKRAELGLTDSDFLIVGIGRLVPQKRPFVFLDNAKMLVRLLPNAKFVWVGDGDLRDLWDERVRKEGLNFVLPPTGWQSDVLPYLLAADLLLHVADFEGLPLAVVEAMAAGLPCAVTKSFASEIELFDDTTVLFADDVEELGRQLRDQSRLAAIARAGRRLAEKRLTVEAMTQAYERLYLCVREEAARVVNEASRL